jgi:hypothetical protein
MSPLDRGASVADSTSEFERTVEVEQHVSEGTEDITTGGIVVTCTEPRFEATSGTGTGFSGCTTLGVGLPNTGSGTTKKITTAARHQHQIRRERLRQQPVAGLGQNNGTYSSELTATGEVDGTVPHSGIWWP